MSGELIPSYEADAIREGSLPGYVCDDTVTGYFSEHDPAGVYERRCTCCGRPHGYGCWVVAFKCARRHSSWKLYYPRAWVHAFAEDCLRSQGRRLLSEYTQAAAGELEARAITTSLWELIEWGAKKRLSPREGWVMLERVQGRTYRDLADDLELSPARVRAIELKARRRLRAYLQFNGLLTQVRGDA